MAQDGPRPHQTITAAAIDLPGNPFPHRMGAEARIESRIRHRPLDHLEGSPPGNGLNSPSLPAHEQKVAPIQKGSILTQLDQPAAQRELGGGVERKASTRSLALTFRKKSASPKSIFAPDLTYWAFISPHRLTSTEAPARPLPFHSVLAETTRSIRA